MEDFDISSLCHLVHDFFQMCDREVSVATEKDDDVREQTEDEEDCPVAELPPSLHGSKLASSCCLSAPQG